MKQFPAFDPSTGKGTVDTGGVNKNQQLMMYNDSLYGLLLTFADKSVDIIPPSWNKSFIIQNVPMGVVEWQVYNQVPIQNYPMSQVYGVLYEDGEHVPQVNAGMQRGFNVTGGSVTTSGQSIVNDGNNAGTTFIESTLAGQSASSVNIKNDGTGTLSTLIAGVLVQVLKLATVDPVLALGAATHMTEILGDIKVDGTTNLGLTKVFGALQAMSTTSLDNGGIFTDGNGLLTVSRLGLPVGFFSRVKQFSGSGTVTATHGLGQIPTILLFQYAGAFGTQPGGIITYNGANATTVNVVATTGYSWTGVALLL